MHSCDAGILVTATMVLALVAGCGSSSGPSLDGMPVEKAAGIAAAPQPAIVVLDEASRAPKMAYRKPVITETKICAAWIPEHVDEEMDVKVGGHWVYFRLADAQWVVSGRIQKDDEPHPPVTKTEFGAIPFNPSLGQGIRDHSKWLVPYRLVEEERSSPSPTPEEGAARGKN